MSENQTMPYYIYQQRPGKDFDRVAEFAAYRPAREEVRRLRAALPADADYTLRIIHARNTDEAVGLMSETREPRPLGEDA
ncbi:MAG: hypothetical protein U5S82_22875 [Gammaproteobacteria bacterium]|nr:hypothetical protein [Gammaproteobacteria bacterium]